jgi:hypothetical protein
MGDAASVSEPELKQQHAALEAACFLAQAGAEAADRREDEFVAMFAHEPRDPLAPIPTPSTSSGSNPRSGSRDAGFEHHLTKPAAFDALQSLLSRARHAQIQGKGE